MKPSEGQYKCTYTTCMSVVGTSDRTLSNIKRRRGYACTKLSLNRRLKLLLAFIQSK